MSLAVLPRMILAPDRSLSLSTLMLMVLKFPNVKSQSPLSVEVSVAGLPQIELTSAGVMKTHVPLDDGMTPGGSVWPEGRPKLGIEKLGMAGILGMVRPPQAMARMATIPSDATFATRITV
jgi:hypothetical protein